MLLEVMAFVGNVGDDFVSVGQTNFGNLTDSRVRLLWGAGHDLHAHPAAERVGVEGRRFGLRNDFAASFTHELVDGGHVKYGGLKLRKEAKRGDQPIADQAIFIEKNTHTAHSN